MPFGVAFGIASADAGLKVWQAAAYSLFVFAGSAQFAAVEVIGDGGTAASAVAAGLLLNLRSLAFGVVLAPDLEGPWWKRAAWSQLMIDETTAVASAQSGRRWRLYGYLWTGLVLFVVWNVTTLVGAAGLSSAGDLVEDWGIDAAIPATFLALLWPRLADGPQRRAALTGALIAAALVPIAPPGIPILAAALGILPAWRSASSPPPSSSPPGDDRPASPDAASSPASPSPAPSSSSSPVDDRSAGDPSGDDPSGDDRPASPVGREAAR